MKLIQLIIASCVSLSIPSFSFATINIPLTVQELLPASVTGIDRAGEVVTGGIPLPENSGITSTSELGLSGVSTGQFRSLGRWPNGNIKWVLLDFPLSLNAGGVNNTVSLVDGEGNFGGSNLATDSGATITVATGVATFTVKKANFNIFDTVNVGGAGMVTAGNAGRLSMIGTDDVEYSSANDSSSTAVIEENGPVRTTIKAVGSFKSAVGTRLMDYTVRLHFFKGKSTTRGEVELRNADHNYPTHQAFKSVAAVVPTVLGGTKSVTFGINGTPITAPLDFGATAYLFQGYNTRYKTYPEVFMGHTGNGWRPPLPGSGGDTYVFDPNYIGVKVQVGGTAVNPFGTVTQYGDSAASIDDSTGKGVTVGFKRLPAFWPGGFEFKDDGNVGIELYSKQNPYNAAKKIYLPYGTHDRRTVLWDFHTSSGNANNATLSKRLEYPLAVRANLSHYLAAKALYGQPEIPTADEEAAFFSSIGKSSYAPSLSNPVLDYIYREGPNATPGGGNQFPRSLHQLINWLRSGNGGWFLLGEQRTLFNNSGAFQRSDTSITQFPTITNPLQAGERLSNTQDWEHMHIQSAPLYYYLSGDEAIREGFVDIGEVVALATTYTLPQSMPLPANSQSIWQRAIGFKMQHGALSYELSCETGSCNNTLKAYLENGVVSMMDARDGGGYGIQYFGRNIDRGYLYWEDPGETLFGQQIRHNHLLYDYIFFEGLWQCNRVMRSGFWNYSRILDVDDFLTGLSQYHFKEWITATPTEDTGMAALNFPYSGQYNLYLDAPTPITAPGGETGRGYQYDFGRSAAWGYTHTNDTDYLTKAGQLIWEAASQGFASQGELQVKQLIYTYNNPANVPIWKSIDVTTTNNGGGSYTLRWTVPEGATNYQIKYSGKTIVEGLGFDQFTRLYQYDPGTHVPFFAASNIPNNPAPSTTGGEQSITLTGLPDDQNFHMKVLSGARLGKRYRMRDM